MYWRVQKYNPQQMLKQYGVYIVLFISLFFNLFQLITRPNLNRIVSNQVKTDFDQFARRVTQHILDTSYITYEGATAALMSPEQGELSPPVIAELKRQQQLPHDLEELKASVKTYSDERRVSAVRIDQVIVSPPDNQNFIPVDVTGVVAVHSAQESDPGPVRFHFRYLIGLRPNTQTPLVAAFQDLSQDPEKDSASH